VFSGALEKILKGGRKDGSAERTPTFTKNVPLRQSNGQCDGKMGKPAKTGGGRDTGYWVSNKNSAGKERYCTFWKNTKLGDRLGKKNRMRDGGDRGRETP